MWLVFSPGCNHSSGKVDARPRVPDFRLNTIEHERFYLNQHNDKVVILVFWATWCRACKKEMLELQSFFKQPGLKDVTIAAICTDPENFAQVQNIVKHLGITYPILMDHGARLFKDFRLVALPTTLVVDQKQRLALSRVGWDGAVMNQVTTKVLSLLERAGH